MLKKIVAFDTSFLTAVENGDIDIENEYPKNEYIRFVQDTVIDEFFLDEQNQWHNRIEKSNFIEQYEIGLLPSFHDLVKKECERGISRDFIKNNHLFNKDLLFYRGQLPQQLQSEMEKKYFALVNERNKAKQSEFIGIPYVNDTAVNIDLLKIQNDIINLTTEGNEYILPIKTDYCNFSIAISERNLILNLQEPPFNKYVQQKFQKLKDKFPTVYNLLVYDRFSNNELKRPQHTNQQKSFLINLKDGSQKISNIKIEINTLPDFRISLAGLPYVDVFATRDKSQVLLTKGLYASYSCKVHYYHNDVRQPLF